MSAWIQRYARFARAAAIATLLILPSCSDSRPAADQWLEDWQTVVTGIPTREELGPTPESDMCSEVLSFLRTSTPGLLPSPDLAVDDPVETWVEVAEDAFFGCPPRSGDVTSFAEAYDELARLEAEVAAALAQP